MKRTILVLLLIIGSMQLRAQQFIQVKPAIKLNDGLQNTFKPNDWQSSQVLLQQPANKFAAANSNSTTVYSTMPVAKAYSTDRMPIVVPGNPNVNYTMLVKKVAIVDPLASAKKQQF